MARWSEVLGTYMRDGVRLDKRAGEQKPPRWRYTYTDPNTGKRRDVTLGLYGYPSDMRADNAHQYIGGDLVVESYCQVVDKALAKGIDVEARLDEVRKMRHRSRMSTRLKEDWDKPRAARNEPPAEDSDRRRIARLMGVEI